MPHIRRPGSRERLAIDVETWVLAPDAFLANHNGGHRTASGKDLEDETASLSGTPNRFYNGASPLGSLAPLNPPKLIRLFRQP